MEVAQSKTGNKQGQPLAVQPHDEVTERLSSIEKTFNISLIQDNEAQQHAYYHITAEPLLKDTPELRTGDTGHVQ